MIRKTLGAMTAAAALAFSMSAATAQDAPTWTETGPIFAANCTGCHGSGGRAGLNLSTYATAIAGSNNGPVLLAGDPSNSLLVKRITGVVTPQMPRGGPPLAQGQIDLIVAWIAGGLPE